MRVAFIVVIAVWLCLAGNVMAQEQVSGPVLQPSDTAPPVCDPNKAGFRYVEVRGTGFDAWSSQHLSGSLFDASGAVLEQWPNVWVTPRGRLTVEVNLCADPIQSRPALATGDYTLVIGPNDGGTIATAGISLAPPNAPDVSEELPAPAPAATLERTGPGSRQQPLPLGAAGSLVDGWQLVIQSVAPDAYPDIKAAVPSALPPAPDQRDFILRVQATYLGPSGTGVLGASRFVLVNPASDQRYDQVANNCGPIAGALPATVVTQATTIGGDVCFMVHAADIGSLLAVDNQPKSAERVYFALQ